MSKDGVIEALRAGRPLGPIGDAGMVWIAASPALEEIERLFLQDAGLGPVGACALAASPYVAQAPSRSSTSTETTSSRSTRPPIVASM